VKHVSAALRCCLAEDVPCREQPVEHVNVARLLRDHSPMALQGQRRPYLRHRPRGTLYLSNGGVLPAELWLKNHCFCYISANSEFQIVTGHSKWHGFGHALRHRESGGSNHQLLPGNPHHLFCHQAQCVDVRNVNGRCSASNQPVMRNVSCPPIAGSTLTFSFAVIASLPTMTGALPRQRSVRGARRPEF
jgi:hypothetical protein